jgi:S1-C subfamily serine protease
MNPRGSLFVAVAIFAGVFGALQFDHVLTTRTKTNLPEIQLPPPTVIPASMQVDSGGGTLDFRAAAKKVIPSVVSVDRYEQLRDFFGDPTQIAETGEGSGVVVTSDGVIVTNNHVVADANGNPVPEVKVRMSDKKSYRAKVIGTDPRSDIAVIKIEGSGFNPVEMGTSGDLQIGQWVMAVGNPLGFDDTVSVGVVSSLKRDLPLQNGGIVNAIQTDAAINPGNSGGALTDQHGRLVGINAAIASSTGGNVGIGFAIPIDRVREVVNDILKYGHTRYGELGIAGQTRWQGALSDSDFRQALAQQVGCSPESVPASGFIIAQVGGPAAALGLKQLDVLMEVDGSPINDQFSLNRALITKKPGDSVIVKWWSQGSVHSGKAVLQETGGTID